MERSSAPRLDAPTADSRLQPQREEHAAVHPSRTWMVRWVLVVAAAVALAQSIPLGCYTKLRVLQALAVVVASALPIQMRCQRLCRALVGPQGLRSGGPHGGLSYGWAADRVVSVLGWWLGSMQNTYEPAYANATERIRAALAPSRPLLSAAGHDHNLQLLEGDASTQYEVVSGAGSVRRVSTVTEIPGTLFAHAYPGFVVLDFHSTPSGEEVRLHGSGFFPGPSIYRNGMAITRVRELEAYRIGT